MEKRALWTLEHADELSPREAILGKKSQLRLWEYSSRGPFRTWTVFLAERSDAEKGRGLVREVVWNRTADQSRVTSKTEQLRHRSKTAPSIRVRDAEVALEDLAPFLEEATRLSGPLPASRENDIQGDRFGIEGFGSMSYLRVEWQDEGPPEWAKTVTWISKLRALLIASIKDRA